MALKYTQRKDGRYATTVMNGYKENGKPNLITIYGKSKTELDKKRIDLIGKLENRSFIEKKVDFKKYSLQWLETKSITIQDHSIRMYKTVLNKYTSSIENLYLKDITKVHIQDIINEHKDKPRTCQQIKLAFNQIFESALDDGLVYRNPCRKLVLPKIQKPQKRSLTQIEHRLSDVAEFNDRECAYIKLIKYCGLRKEEALALHKLDFDFEKNVVSINKALIFVNNRPKIKEPKSNAGYRIIPMTTECSTFMNYYINSLENEYLFYSINNNELITEQSFKKMWASIMDEIYKKADELKLDKPVGLTSHVFRHNYATMLYHAGVGLKEAQYLMGHSSISMTLDIYTHLDHNTIQATSKLDKYLATLS